MRNTNALRNEAMYFLLDCTKFHLSKNWKENRLQHINKCVQTRYDAATSTKTKLRGQSPQANYADRATVACRRT
jgi:hypothetical protein